MQTTHFINGEWVAGQGHTIQSVDPAKDQVIWEGQAATAAQVGEAIAAARNALTDWSFKSFDERLTVIKKYGDKFANTPADTIHAYVESIQREIERGKNPKDLPEKKTVVTE